MPDPTRQAQRKAQFDPARIQRIQELAHQWGVPTRDIFTNVTWGYDESINVPRQATYFTFDEAGKVNRQKIDYGPVVGWPAGTYSPAPTTPLTQKTKAQVQAELISAASNAAGRPAMKKGGKLKKAQYGDLVPLRRPSGISSALEHAPVAPFQTSDPALRRFFAEQVASGLVPADASLNGPDPYAPQYLLDPATGKVSPDNYTPLQLPAAPPAPRQGGSGFSMDINPGAIITGVNTAINNLYDRSRGLKEFNRLKRKQLQGPGYNPYQYGTGSQAIYQHGGAVKPISDNSYSAPVLQFNGPSHAEGGIPINYAGKNVEVEGQETAWVDGEGDLNIFGDLTVPGTRMKFKTAAKKIASAETKAARKMNNALQLLKDADPGDRFDRLRTNTAALGARAAADQQQALTMLKERLSLLQEEALAASGNPATVQARHGAAIAQDGKKVLKPSMAERHNNPGNIKYAPWLKKYGAVKGEAASDGGNFARFPSREGGLRAMKALLQSPSYASRTVDDAIVRWTGGSGYKLPLGELQGKTVKSLSESQLRDLMDLITSGEDSKLYDLDFLFGATPKDPVIDSSLRTPRLTTGALPGVPGTYTNAPPSRTPVPGRQPTPPPDLPHLQVPQTPRSPLRNPLRFSQVAPELLALMERPGFVPGQRYEPALYQPYQVSFQDRLNENQSTFNRAAMLMGDNPSALSVLAGQKYLADSGVLADEFRTNQGITADITNKNIALLNDAQLKNLGLADTQFVRQEQAKANTRANINNAISSIASKIDQNRLETRSYNAVSSLFPQYTFDRQGNLQYVPNTSMRFGMPGSGSSNDNFYTRSRTEYDRSGALRKTVVNTPSEAEQAKMDYLLWNNRLKQRTGAFDHLRRVTGFN